ncbi:MFS transporter [Nostoc sp. UCD121]|uniref:MDR family MFS transporter n=1 Tax=unclassified Nostoc TaxID=2593658 RepID=UPI0016286B53|nr:MULTISPECIES: MFS transporter [unclassified Nostoc]MBC1223861.1 MFS transporter [Nostoc sp. UCD120]MBC1275827.1 MFS transporter [Nostoc sp. UCD121]MBC1295468.1 MFS transporter [Nostoc sp. UCD122]
MTSKLMKLASQSQLSSWLPSIHPQVWIFAIGRFLSEVGTGCTLFYAPIFFVNEVGLSATSVGVALGSASISGIVGRIVGGSLADSEHWGRRRTLLLATAISAIASLVLAATNDFTILVIGSLISGLGIGFYWPAAEAVVADASQIDNRRETFAIARLADNLGLAIGIMLAGFLISIIGSYRWLFVVDAISFLMFFGVVYVGISKTEQQQIKELERKEYITSWMAVLSDRRFLVYIAVNIFFTIYISQIHSTLPLYFKNFVIKSTTEGFAQTTISVLFTWHLVLAIIFQLPVTTFLKRCSHTLALTVSAILWGVGFGLIWVSGTAPSYNLAWVALALGVFAVAIVSYTPSAASLVTELAPENQRGVYFSVNAVCWAIGSFIGHPLGGWALDQPPIITNTFWLGFPLSVLIVVVILQYLNRILPE